MLIEQMMEEDLESVAQIEKCCFSQPWTKQGFKESLALSYTIFFVAKIDNKVAGYIGMYTSLEEGEITNVAVSPEYRNQGVGRALVQKMVSFAKDQNLTQIVLEVRVSNTAAIHVYEKMEFQSVGIRKGFYDKPKEDAMIMICSII